MEIESYVSIGIRSNSIGLDVIEVKVEKKMMTGNVKAKMLRNRPL